MTLEQTFELLINLDIYLKKSDYKRITVINSTGLTRQNFYRKMKNKSFTLIEIIKMLPYLKPEESELLEDSLLYDHITKEDYTYLSHSESKTITDDLQI